MLLSESLEVIKNGIDAILSADNIESRPHIGRSKGYSPDVFELISKLIYVYVSQSLPVSRLCLPLAFLREGIISALAFKLWMIAKKLY
jgi:hypothetical protein